jgi:UDP-N-acetylmuramoyl-tripeptide--D-alanyl-D-alanine ligase
VISQDGAPPAGPGVIRVADTQAALLRLAAAYRQTLTHTRVIAVGGSNGKTTTVRLLEAVLSPSLRGSASPKSFNNAVGVPLTMLAAKRTDQFLICEVGTNAPGEIAPLTRAVQPDIAVITSIGREHLEGLGSIQGVLQEEVTLLTGLREGGLAVLSADAPGLLDAAEAVLAASGAHRLSFGFADDADVRITGVEQTLDGLEFRLNDRQAFRLPLLGRHNASNAAAAVAVSRRFALDHAAVREALAGARGAPMRLERRTIDGIHLLNDAYNANPDSVLASLRTFEEVCPPAPGRRRVLILGDMLELGPQAPALHREIADALAQRPPDLVVLVGPLSRATAERLRPSLPEGAVLHLDSLHDGGDRRVAALLRPGDAVLLKASRGMGLERVIAALGTPPRVACHS